MPTSSSRFTYADCLDVFDRALASPRGVRLRFPDEGEARQYCMRLNKARRLHRIDNAETYETDHPLHGRSEYDIFIVKVKRNTAGWVVTLERNDVSIEIEEL